MPYYRIETYTTTGTKTSWGMDNDIASFNASVAISPQGGTATCTLQYTLNPLNDPTATDASAFWINSSLTTGTISTTTVVTFSNPFSRIRVLVNSLTGTALTMEMCQGLSVD